MPEFDHSQFLATTLDPALLSTPFRVQTNWHVITGASSSGKTTLINLMKDRGIKTSPERARQYIESELAKGRSLDEMHKDMAVFNMAIMAFTLNEERKLPPGDTIFLDRGVPDTLSYCRIVGVNPNECLPVCFHLQYASVIILDRLPFHHDGVRYEDDEIAEFLHQWSQKDYIALGYNPIKVPVMPVEERLSFILGKLTEQGLI